MHSMPTWQRHYPSDRQNHYHDERRHYEHVFSSCCSAKPASMCANDFSDRLAESNTISMEEIHSLRCTSTKIEIGTTKITV
jgi:hypothetical protein